MTKDPGTWQPPDGAAKLQCTECNHWFVSRDGKTVCANCLALRARVTGARSTRNVVRSDGPGYRSPHTVVTKIGR